MNRLKSIKKALKAKNASADGHENLGDEDDTSQDVDNGTAGMVTGTLGNSAFVNPDIGDSEHSYELDQPINLEDDDRSRKSKKKKKKKKKHDDDSGDDVSMKSGKSKKKKKKKKSKVDGDEVSLMSSSSKKKRKKKTRSGSKRLGESESSALSNTQDSERTDRRSTHHDGEGSESQRQSAMEIDQPVDVSASSSGGDHVMSLSDGGHDSTKSQNELDMPEEKEKEVVDPMPVSDNETSSNEGVDPQRREISGQSDGSGNDEVGVVEESRKDGDDHSSGSDDDMYLEDEGMAPERKDHSMDGAASQRDDSELGSGSIVGHGDDESPHTNHDEPEKRSEEDDDQESVSDDDMYLDEGTKESGKTEVDRGISLVEARNGEGNEAAGASVNDEEDSLSSAMGDKKLIQTLKTEQLTLQEEFDKLRSQKEQLEQTVASLNEQVKDQNTALQNQQESDGSEKLQEELTRALDEKAKLMESTQMLEEEKIQLQEATSELKSEKATLEATISTLNQDMEEQRDEAEMLRRQLKETEDIKAVNEEASERIAGLEEGLRLNTEEKAAIEEELKRAKEVCDAIAAEKDDLEETVTSLKAQLDTQTKENKNLLEELSKAKEESTSLHATETSQQVGEQTGELAAVQKQLEDALEMNARLSMQQDKQGAGVDDVKNQSSSELEEEMKLILEEKTKLEETVDFQDDRLEKLDQRNAELEDEMKLILEEKMKLEDTVDSQDDRLEKLEDIIEVQLERIETLEGELVAVEDEMFKMEDELKELKGGQSKREGFVETVKAERLTRQASMRIERQSSQRVLSMGSASGEGLSRGKGREQSLSMDAISEDAAGLKLELEEKEKQIAKLEEECKSLRAEEQAREEDLRLIQEDIDEKFAKLEKHNTELRSKYEKAQKKAAKAHDLEKAVRNLKEQLEEQAVPKREETMAATAATGDGTHGENLAREQRIIELEEELEAAKKVFEFEKSDDYVERLKKELKTYKDGHRNLKRKMKAEQQDFLKKSRKKDETIEFLQKEMIKMRKDVEFRLAQQKQKRNSAKISMTDAAQQQMQDLEDEIVHWKGANIELEEEVSKLRVEANDWKKRAKELGYTDDNGDDDDDELSGADDESVVSFRSRFSQMSSAFFHDDVSTTSSRFLKSPRDNMESTPSQRGLRGLGGLWKRMKSPQGAPNNPAIPYTSGLLDD